jgi:hypothetical protein
MTILAAAGSLVFLIMLVSCHKPKEISATPIHLYIAAGQSNMVGHVAFAEQRHMEPLRRVQFGYHPNQNTQTIKWSPIPIFYRHGSIARNFRNARLRGVGPWWSFARRMADMTPDVEIRVLVLAVNGSSLNEWMPGGRLYKRNLAAIQRSLSSGMELKGIIWHQGESGTGLNGAEYGSMFQDWIVDLRQDLDCPSLPFVAGKLGEQAPNRAEVNAALDRLDNSLQEFTVVDIPNKTLSDRVHFNTETSERLGTAMANAMLMLQNTSIVSVIRTQNNPAPTK